jgi:hypothetical protein
MPTVTKGQIKRHQSVIMHLWQIEIKENQKLAIQIHILSVACLPISSRWSIIAAIAW